MRKGGWMDGVFFMFKNGSAFVSCSQKLGLGGGGTPSVSESGAWEVSKDHPLRIFF